MKTAIYPGSFDPVTLGHLDIIERASRIFDRLIVLVSKNSDKCPLFSSAERTEMLAEVTKTYVNVEVEEFEGLLSDYAGRLGGCVIVKGMRAVSDFEHEFQMAMINNALNSELDTLFLTTSQNFLFLSSSVVKEVASYGGDISEFVPKEIIRRVEDKLCERGMQNGRQR